MGLPGGRGQPIITLMQVGTLIADRFVIERQVGAGGMGAVYRAIDRRSGAPVALKLVISDDHKLHARARVEAEVLAAVDHPALVHFIESGTTPDGRPFLAMEWLEGEDLAARSRALPSPSARPSSSVSASPTGSTRSTRAASCTAISSHPTSSSRGATSQRPSWSTSASPAAAASGAA